MSELELVDLGASGLDDETKAVWVQCRGPEIAPGVASDYGKAPFMCALGIAARCAPADETGNAQGVVGRMAGIDGVLIAGFDPRASKVHGEIGPGETAVFATGKDYDSRILLKDQMVAVVIGDDMAFVLDRKAMQIAWAVGGYAGKVSKEDGWVFLSHTGTAGLQIKDDMVWVGGPTTIIGGRNPVASVGMVPAQTGVPSGGAVPAAPGVFIGA